jgi:hypothetical protein
VSASEEFDPWIAVTKPTRGGELNWVYKHKDWSEGDKGVGPEWVATGYKGVIYRIWVEKYIEKWRINPGPYDYDYSFNSMYSIKGSPYKKIENFPYGTHSLAPAQEFCEAHNSLRMPWWR